MNQIQFDFDAGPRPTSPRIVPTDPNVVPAESPRLTGQNLKILQRLRQGQASNKELSQIALKYTSRISDLRKFGFDVVVVNRDYETGLTFYALREATA